MKIKITRKRAAIAMLLIIVVPILYNKTSGFLLGMIQQQMMRMPREVVSGNPKYITTNVNAEATGRVEAKYSVDIIARVPGFLDKKYFKEGDFVKKNQTLFQIDPREYRLEVNNSQATVNQYRALLTNSQQELDRANALIKEDLVSHSYVDESLARRNQNQALLDAARQKLELARVNLSYTTIKSPIDGRIGKVQITEGNYVTVNSGSLVNISSVDPVYVVFSLRSADFIKLLKASDMLKDVQVKAQFESGMWYDKIGKIDFVDNQIDKNSGSVQMRAVFENPKGWLVPGDYMKVNLIAPKEVSFLTIPQACTKGDAMSGYYVWALKSLNAPAELTWVDKLMGKKEPSKKEEVVRKDIKVADVIDNNWIVTEGLDQTDNVVTAGVQNIIAEGQKVKVIDEKTYNKKQQKNK